MTALPGPTDLGIDLNAPGRKPYQAYAIAYAVAKCEADQRPAAVPTVNAQANHALGVLGRGVCSPETVTRYLRSQGTGQGSFLRERYEQAGWRIIIGHKGLDAVVEMPDFKGVVPAYCIAAVRTGGQHD